MGEKGIHPLSSPGRLWECEQRRRCAVEGGPAWVPKGMRETYKVIHTKEKKVENGDQRHGGH